MHSPKNPRSGQAALQAALGIAIVIGLVLINIPVSNHQRAEIQRESCIEGLAWIAAAKEEVAQHDNLPLGAAVTMDRLTSTSKLLSRPPVFPEGVEPQINPIGKLPTCVYGGETLTPLTDYGRFSLTETV